jgi:hypothetical protein
MNKPVLSELRYVKIEDHELLSEVLARYTTPRSAYDIVNLMIWGTQFKAQWMEYEGRLVLYNETWTCILMPLGEYLSPQEMLLLSESFYEAGRCGAITQVDTEYYVQYEPYLEEFEIIKDYNTADYIYLTERLAKLSGKKLQKKKNLISQFKRIYGDYEVEKLQQEDGEECLRLSDKWMEDHPEDKDNGYKYERKALKLAFEFFSRFGMEGLVIRYKQDIIAFTLFTEQKEDMALIHFEKFDRSFKGVAQLINWETARYLLPRYHYLNREEDMGIPGLRKSKLSYQPLMVLDSYKLINKKRKKEREQSSR